MYSLSDFIAQAMHRLNRLVLMAFLGIFVVSFLLLGVSVALMSVVWSLMRGRKPAMVTVFQHFRHASPMSNQNQLPKPPALFIGQSQCGQHLKGQRLQ